MTFHEFLRKDFRPLKARRCLRRPEDTKSRFAKQIHDPRCERIVGADDREANVILCREARQGGMIRYLQIASNGGGARVAWRAKNLIDAGGLPELPGESMFAAAAADDHYIHWKEVSIKAY